MIKTNDGGMLSCAHCQKDVSGECTIYYTNDGDYVDETFILHKQCSKPFIMNRNGYVHECPKCTGEGKMVRPSSVWGGSITILSPGTFDVNHDPCDLCEGKGYLKKPPIPVTKITEWKRDE